MRTLKLAIIDAIGLDYDGNTLEKFGIGGSESAIISMAKELTKLGFDTKVFNDCRSDRAQPGVYDGVEYLPISALAHKDYNFDIVISQRTVIPFVPIDQYDLVRQPPPRDYNPAWFTQLQKPSQLKIVWQQDTFLWGDALLEKLAVNNNIDLIFNLSDWHINYTTSCDHGHKRQFEMLKPKMFLTRNAINRWIDWVDIKQKDPNLFVYNASITKGMIPLVTKIWPRIKQQLPNAKLVIIGGYYKFRDEPLSPAQQQWQQLADSVAHDPSVTFTGIISQPQIAQILANASYNLYPGAYPETAGISTLESINYNTPVIGTRFGAMAETGTELAGYYIDYAVEPNGLFPWINSDEQIERYIKLVEQVVSNPYLHQQKQYACNIAKEVSTWDTVALQWKQLFYNWFDQKLTDDELKSVTRINSLVHQYFGRSWTNPCEVIVDEFHDTVEPLPSQNPTMAIIDIVGTCYDGDTLTRRGLGGSESAVILMSRELVKQGFSVTVYNACDEDDCKPGVYDGVTYLPLSAINDQMPQYDVVISSRCVTPFVVEGWRHHPQHTPRKIDYYHFDWLQKTTKLKVVWMHDTFCQGDHLLEDLTAFNAIDEIWTLTDFHNFYVANCSHPRMRNFEVLRNHLWTTRNGIVDHGIDNSKTIKIPNHFVFNANMSKGLDALLNHVWPEVKKKIPNASLTVVGGHYKLGSTFSNSSEQTEFEQLIAPHINDTSIKFTGIVTQKRVAEIFSMASFFIYPTQLPETYGISTVESLYQQTPLITCRFGGLEETATNQSYMIDYSLTPNSVYPNIDQAQQTKKFVDLVVSATSNTAKNREIRNALKEIRDIVLWSDVALEWKHHLYYKLGLYLSPSELKRALYTEKKYQKIFGRRLSSSEQWLFPLDEPQQKIVVISTFRNAAPYLQKHINSVASQLYDNYEHWLIDDHSTDNSAEVAINTIKSLPADLQNKFNLVRHLSSRGAVHNQIDMIRQLDPNSIVILLDGDDWLINRPDIFSYYNHLHCDYDYSYGSCWSVVDDIPLIAQPYPPEIKDSKTYRDYRFNWNIPYTHLRTFKAKLLQNIPDEKFQNSDGDWYRAGGDILTFYNAVENCDPLKLTSVPHIFCNYNDASPYNDYKINSTQQTQTVTDVFGVTKPNSVISNNSKLVLNNSSVVPLTKTKELKIPERVRPVKRILIAIPTNRNIEAETFKSIYDLEIPDGYHVDFQYFWGYQVEQVRNLIASWVVRNNYDYLFAVDSDIAFASDTLKKLLSHDRDMVSGVYIQRIPGTHTLELTRENEHGGMDHIQWETIAGQGLVPVDGCGFGCVLIKSQLFKTIPYPQFVYRSALDHAYTFSEDFYFCQQAKRAGFKLWADTSIICDHIGSYPYKVKPPQEAIQTRLRELAGMNLLCKKHLNYLNHMRDNLNINPKVVYDIGAAVLHWTIPASHVWPAATFHAVEAMEHTAFLYEERKIPYAIAMLSEHNGIEKDFYQNVYHPGGNSYYRESTTYSPNAHQLFNDQNRVKKQTINLDTLVKNNNWPLPDLIKIDVQGAELDVLKGATQTLKHCQHLIVELQLVEYNTGAPKAREVIEWICSQGFKLVKENFVDDPTTGDYHFSKS